MGLVVLGLLLLAVGSLASPSLSGTYRQYNPDENDVIIAVIDDDDDYHTTTTFTFGVNEFTIEFEDEEDDVWNVKYEYSRADATPHTQDAVDALENSCPEEGSFAIGRSTSVVRCLFCGGDRYDILRETDDGFQLGAGVACSREERPTEFEEYEFEEIDSFSSASALAFPLFSMLVALVAYFAF